MTLYEIQQEAESFFPTDRKYLVPSVSELLVFTKHILDKAQQWRPIESAPKEGEFLVYMPNERTKIQTMKARLNVSLIGGSFAFDLTKPTHWQPLPPAPEAA